MVIRGGVVILRILLGLLSFCGFTERWGTEVSVIVWEVVGGPEATELSSESGGWPWFFWKVAQPPGTKKRPSTGQYFTVALWDHCLVSSGRPTSYTAPQSLVFRALWSLDLPMQDDSSWWHLSLEDSSLSTQSVRPDYLPPAEIMSPWLSQPSLDTQRLSACTE